MIADIEDLEEMDASELHARRLNAKEVLTPIKGFLRGEPDGLSSSIPLQDDSTRIYRHDMEPRVKLYVPTEESVRLPLKHIDVTRTTDT